MGGKDAKKTITSLNQITHDLSESNKENTNTQQDTNDPENKEDDSQNEPNYNPISYFKSLSQTTQYFVIGGSIIFPLTIYVLTIGQLIILWSLIIIGFGAVWFGRTDLSVEITVFLAKFFPASSQAIWDTHKFEWTKKFRDNYEIIYNEYLEFEKNYNYCPQMDDAYPNGSITNWDRKWPTVTLRCYGLDSKVSKFFPKTMALLNDKTNPYWLSHCMYSILEPDKFIPRHRGPYRGVFRYQLALEVPPCRDPERLYLAVWPNTSSYEFWYPENVPDGIPLKKQWSPGEDFIFDDTCVHEVRNNTVCRRIILFMDVERHDISFFSSLVHKFFMTIARFLPAVKQVCVVQDKFIEDNLIPIDPNNEIDKIDEPNKMRTNFKNNIDHDDDWIIYRQASVPELAPFKRARILIEKLKNKKRKSLLQ